MKPTTCRLLTMFATMFGCLCSAALWAQDSVNLQSPKRSWGTEQVLGEPDTFAAGDIETAWASASQDDQREWLIVSYAEKVMPRTLAIHETYNPGAVDKVTVFDEEGEEVVVWEGEDPTRPGSDKGISVIPIRTRFPVQKFKISINSPAVSGWNEIDAIALTSTDGDVQWAVEAEASTTYAGQFVEGPATFVPVEMARIERLENEVAELKAEVQRLKAIETQLAEIKKLLESDR